MWICELAHTIAKNEYLWVQCEWSIVEADLDERDSANPPLVVGTRCAGGVGPPGGNAIANDWCADYFLFSFDDCEVVSRATSSRRK